MQESITAPQALERAPDARDLHWTWTDWRMLLLLLLLATGIRTWQITHTEVTARDSIGFIRIAWMLDQAPLSAWPALLGSIPQHPVYPLAVLAASQPLRQVVNGSPAEQMQLSAQLVSAVCAVLLVLPVFCLGRELLDRRVGFGAATLLQCLPVSGCILADGLSEATFLLFASSALFWSVRALRQPRAVSAFALTGFFGGLAYLTRPEGGLIVAATGLVLLVSQAVRAWRRSTRDLLLCGGALSLAALLLTVPFVAITGRVSQKPSILRVLESRLRADNARVPPPSMTSGGVLLADYHITLLPEQRVWPGLTVLVKELVKGSFYIGWAAALLGLWRHGRRTVAEPGAWALLLVCLGVALGVWQIYVVVGYLSDRHVLLILFCGSFWAVAGLIALGEWMATLSPRLRFLGEGYATMTLALLFAFAGLPKTLHPLHQHRAGFREVGHWLAEHVQPGDEITDPLCWAHYYSGRVFLEGTGRPISPGYQAHEYIVVEDAGNPHPRLPAYQVALAKANGAGPPVYEWSGPRGKKWARVLVYALPLQPASP